MCLDVFARFRSKSATHRSQKSTSLTKERAERANWSATRTGVLSIQGPYVLFPDPNLVQLTFTYDDVQKVNHRMGGPVRPSLIALENLSLQHLGIPNQPSFRSSQCPVVSGGARSRRPPRDRPRSSGCPTRTRRTWRWSKSRWVRERGDESLRVVFPW